MTQPESAAEGMATHDLPTVQSLVRLRLLAEDAAHRVDDISEVGRHQTLIALDGACEYALWLAARRGGVRLRGDQRAGLPALHRAIAEQRSTWKLVGWSGVNQMHEARNTAQHAGVAPDREQLPIWRDAAVAFIDSLSVAAFGMPLADVVLAIAVRDQELRTILTAAEHEVNDTGRSFSASVTAFNLARGRWRAQRDAALAARVADGYQPILMSEEAHAINELTEAVHGLADVLEVQPFVGDVGEYVWFRRALGERAEARWLPSPEDARRALVFVAGWVVRWEVFTLGYPDDQWEAHRESIAPPEIGDGAAIRIIGAQADLLQEAPGQPARTLLFLQLANVPGRGRAPWDSILARAVQDRMRGIKTARGEPALLHLHWYYSGVLSLRLNMGADETVVADSLERAVEDAAAHYAEHAVESAERELRRQRLETRLSELFAEARADPAIFGEVSVVPDEWMGTFGLFACVPVLANLDNGDPLEGYYVQEAFNGQTQHLAHLHQRGSNILFAVDEPSNVIENAIRDAIINASNQVAHLRQLRMAQMTTHSAFAFAMRERFGPLPRA